MIARQLLFEAANRCSSPTHWQAGSTGCYLQWAGCAAQQLCRCSVPFGLLSAHGVDMRCSRCNRHVSGTQRAAALMQYTRRCRLLDRIVGCQGSLRLELVHRDVLVQNFWCHDS
jgi:hypothetical protein